MCGIAGFIDLRAQTSAHELNALAILMAESLRHRGPDGLGVWTDQEAGLAFAHSRLSVRDLSPAGSQPMISNDGRFVMIYNGEIYDIEDMRAELDRLGVRFQGSSDTEVLLYALARHGVERTLPRLNGMFAFALWDRLEKTITLACDRMGIKPLFFAAAEGLFLFGSELKALAVHPGWRPQLNQEALAAYARLSYVPPPLCIFSGASKLEPGTYLTMRLSSRPKITRYFDMAKIATQERLNMDAKEATDELLRLLSQAVRRRLVSDVPLGVFLSGGVDSSMVAALAGPRVKTFTASFEEAAYDESKDALEVAKRLGADHSSITITAREALDCIPDLPRYYDEPFADSSQIPMLLISRFTRKHVTVALSGDGGDEMFAGYNRYLWAGRYWPRQRMIPLILRRLAAQGIEALPPAIFDRLGALAKARQLAEKAQKLAAVLRFDDAGEAYLALAASAGNASQAVLGAHAPPMPSPPPELSSPLERMQYLDAVTYLPGDILTKVDRASMAASLEARLPLLDCHVVSFAWRLPRRFRIDGGRTKVLLRQALYRHLPPSLFEKKPKSGFAVPLAGWLRGPLREWALSLLSPAALQDSGCFNPALVSRWLDDHLGGRRNRCHALWNILMFQSWHQMWAAARPRAKELPSRLS